MCIKETVFIRLHVCADYECGYHNINNTVIPFLQNIPRSFSTSHMDPRMTNTCYDMKLVLVQSLGKMKTRECKMDVRCKRNYNCNGNGFMVLSKGWKEVACRSNLKVGDVCMFELVSPLTFMLYIFAVVKPTQTKSPVQPCQLPILRTRSLSSLQWAFRITNVVKTETADSEAEPQ